MRIISYGGGVQSTALIVLAVQGVIDADVALFSNVGDDSEHPATLAYVHDVMMPWAANHGFTIHELRKYTQRGRYKGYETLWELLTRPDSRSIPIPVRLPPHHAPGTRQCTVRYKIEVIDQWLKFHGATADNPADVLVGISVDEIERASRARPTTEQRRRYPLLDLGMTRDDCKAVIADAGLPVPPKSACFFCPFHRLQDWHHMKQHEPELFERAQQLEDVLNQRRRDLQLGPVYLSRTGQRLTDGIASDSQTAFNEGIGESGCDEGVCFV